MVVLTRFISTSATPESIGSTNLANPDVYSRVDAAQTQGADEFFKTLTHESNQITNTAIGLDAQDRQESIHEQLSAERRTAQYLQAQEHVRKQQAHEQLQLAHQQQQMDKQSARWYSTDVSAAMSASMFQTLRKTKAEVQPGGDAVTPVLGEFDKAAAEALTKAPNNEARLMLGEKFIPYRTRLAQQAMVLQDSLNNQHLLNGLGESAKNLSAIVQDEPTQLQSTQQLLEQQAKGLKERGVPATSVDKALAHHIATLHMVTGLSFAEKQPEKVLEELDKGGFNDLGANVVQAMKQRANGVIDKNIKDVDQNIKDVNKRLIEGLPLDQDLKALNERADKYGLTDKAQATNFYSQLADSARGQTLAGLEQQKFNVISKASTSPNTTPEMLGNLHKFYDQRIKMARDDPFAYAANQGIIPDGSNIPRINPGDNPTDPAVAGKIKQLKVYGAEVQKALGLGSPVVPFSKGTFEEFHQKLIGQSPEEQIRSLEVLNGFDTDTMYKAAETIAPKNPGLGMAIGMRAKETNGAVTPELQKKQIELSDEIIKGTPLLVAGALGQNKTSGGATVSSSPHAEISAANAETLGGLFENDPSVVAGFEKAARAVSAFRSANGKEGADYKTALEQVSGVVHVGQLFRTGDDYKTIPPVRGWGKEEMENLIDKMNSPEEWTKYGNGTPYYADGTGIDFRKTPSYKFQYIPIDSHRYIVQQEVAGQKVAVKNENGDPFILNLFKAAGAHAVTK